MRRRQVAGAPPPYFSRAAAPQRLEQEHDRHHIGIVTRSQENSIDAPAHDGLDDTPHVLLERFENGLAVGQGGIRTPLDLSRPPPGAMAEELDEPA